MVLELSQLAQHTVLYSSGGGKNYSLYQMLNVPIEPGHNLSMRHRGTSVVRTPRGSIPLYLSDEKPHFKESPCLLRRIHASEDGGCLSGEESIESGGEYFYYVVH